MGYGLLLRRLAASLFIKNQIVVKEMEKVAVIPQGKHAVYTNMLNCCQEMEKVAVIPQGKHAIYTYIPTC